MTYESLDSNGMEVSSDDCEPTPSSEDASEEFEDNDQEEEMSSGCPRLFKLTLVNSYGTAELDTQLRDDDTSLKLNSLYISILENHLSYIFVIENLNVYQN